MRGVALLLMTLTGSGAVAPAAYAQIDPVGVGQGAVLSTTMRAHSNRISAGRTGNSARHTSPQQAARICGNLPNYRARFGAGDSRVVGLTRACRQGGYALR